MFEIEMQPAKPASVNLRSELHGDDHVPAVDLSFTHAYGARCRREARRMSADGIRGLLAP